jgi:hypothetical protein
MKRHIGILAIGIALSAVAVSAEVHRSAVSHSVPSLSGTTAIASQSSLKEPITTTSTVSITPTRPTIKGGAGNEGEDD